MDHRMPVSPWPEWQITSKIKIGEGAYGTVYKAERSEQGHVFYSAIKVISVPGSREELNVVLSETGDEITARKYFENVMQDCIREISTMENFRGNSHIVSVEDYKVTEYLDEIGWDIYIRMECLTSFQEYCDENGFSPKDAEKLGRDICRALGYLEKKNIVHRDIKPENIFVSRFGDYKIGDFGIARKLEQSLSGISKKGTQVYMAPEVYHGEQYDARADIYSLGIVLYRLTNHNRLPFVSLSKQLITYHDKEEALSRRMAGEKFLPPDEADELFASVIMKACAYEPENRYQTPEDMQKDLELLGLIGRGEVRPELWTASGAEKNTGAEESLLKEILEEDNPEDAGRPQIKQPQENPKEIPEDAEKPRKTGGFKKMFPWVAAVLAVAVIVCVFVSVYIRRTLVDTVREQTEQMLKNIESRSEIESDDMGEDFASSIELISMRTAEIVKDTPDYTRTGSEGKVLRYYDDEGEIRRVLVYPEESAEGMYEEYYYWNGDLIFAYIWDDLEEEMYYYRDGILLRWIDGKGTVHDNEQDDEEYLERGDKYWINSILWSE